MDDLHDTVRVEVDMAVCQNYGQCVFEAPEVFDLDDEDSLVFDPAPPAALSGKVDAAVSACPVQAIRVTAATRA